MLRKLMSKTDKINCFRGWLLIAFPITTIGSYFWILLSLLPAGDYSHVLFIKALINKPGLSVLITVWSKKNLAAPPQFSLM